MPCSEHLQYSERTNYTQENSTWQHNSERRHPHGLTPTRGYDRKEEE